MIAETESEAVHGREDEEELAALAADLAYNVRKSERLTERDAEFALDLQQRHLRAVGELP